MSFERRVLRKSASLLLMHDVLVDSLDWLPGFRQSRDSAGAWVSKVGSHHEIFMQDGAEALQSSSPASTGVYVGTVWEEYQVVQDHLKVPSSVSVLTGSGLSFLIGRVSYTFGLQGTCSPGVCCTLLTKHHRPQPDALSHAFLDSFTAQQDKAAFPALHEFFR